MFEVCFVLSARASNLFCFSSPWLTCLLLAPLRLTSWKRHPSKPLSFPRPRTQLGQRSRSSSSSSRSSNARQRVASVAQTQGGRIASVASVAALLAAVLRAAASASSNSSSKATSMAAVVARRSSKSQQLKRNHQGQRGLHRRGQPQARHGRPLGGQSFGMASGSASFAGIWFVHVRQSFCRMLSEMKSSMATTRALCHKLLAIFAMHVEALA